MQLQDKPNPETAWKKSHMKVYFSLTLQIYQVARNMVPYYLHTRSQFLKVASF